MAAGYPVTAAQFDQVLGDKVQAVRHALQDIADLKALLDDADLFPDAALAALGKSPADITLIRAAVADLKKLRDIAYGQATQAAPNDFFYNAKRLLGLTLP